MKQWIWMIVFVMPMVMTAAEVRGEFYQYTDPQGNLIFTDDITTVPEDQRPGVQTHESIESQPAGAVADVPEETSSGRPEDADIDTSDDLPFASDVSELPDTGPVEEDDLDREKARLDALHDQLMSERKRLSEMPVDQMNNIQRNVHQDNINRLNVRLRDFDRQVERFQQRVREYNIRLRPDSPGTDVPGGDESM